MNQYERRETIEEYGRGFDLLAAALNDVPRNELSFAQDLCPIEFSRGQWCILRWYIFSMAGLTHSRNS